MDKIIFQEGSFLIQPVTKVVEKTETSFTFLQTSLKRFGQHLGVDAAKIAQLEAKINNGTVELADAFDEILRSWKSCKGSCATLNVLIDAFVELKLIDIAEALQTEFCQGFNDVNITVQGRLYKLNKIWENSSECVQYAQLADKIMKSSKSGVEILKQNVNPPAKPPYYVLRTLLARQTKLKLDVFSNPETKDMVFAIKGVTLSELGKIAGKEGVEKSGKQLHQVTSRFILLQHDEDYDRICKNAGRIVHLIHKKDNTYFWINSTGNIDGIRKFFVDETTTLREDELVKTITTSKLPSSILISDTAGMGKTTLLANLAIGVQMSLPTCIVLFIALPELVQQTPQTTNSENLAINAIATYACEDLGFIAVFEKMLLNNTHKFVLFLDGYDEVRHEKLSLVDQFLMHAKQLQNTTLFVTTRPHLKQSLENLFHALAYEIQPFTKSDQISYLVKYWTTHKYSPAESGQRLDQFAAKCLQMLQTKITGNQKPIAGIPLQCYLLAEVFVEPAKRASEIDDSELDLEINSIFDMFNKLYDFKFQRLRQTFSLHTTTFTEKTKKENKVKKQHYRNAHVLASIKLLIPEWQEKLEKYLVLSSDIDDSVMCSIGFVEKCPNDSALKFIHRTFAEYFLAKFLISTVGQYGVSVELIFGTLLGGNGLTIFQTAYPFPNHYVLTNPGIAYFLDQHLREHLKLNRLDYDTIFRLLVSKNIARGTLCAILQASCCDDLENCFDLVKTLLEVPDKNVWNDTSLTEKFFKFLPHLTLFYWTSDSLKKKVLAKFIMPDMQKQLYQPEKPKPIAQLSQKFPDFKFEFGPFYYTMCMETYSHILSDPISRKLSSLQASLEYTYPWIPNCSPLHVAVYISNFAIVKDLIHLYKKCLPTLKYLVHLLVHNSALKTAEVVNEILDVLELLADVAKDNKLEWLNEKVEFDLTPLLLPRVHFTITKKLVELGSDINACSKQTGTFLHSFTGNVEAYKTAVKWALKNQFHCINFKDKDGFTPLHRAMTVYGDQINDDIIDVFHKAKADFRITNMDGTPLVFTALKTGNLEFAEKFLKRGCKINIRTHRENAAHLVLSSFITGVPIFPEQLPPLKWLFKNGFDLINDSTSGLAPLHVAMSLKDLKIDVLEFLKSNKANFKAKDAVGNSVLFHAIMNHQRLEVLNKIIEYCGGFDPRYTNMNGDSALHFAVSSANFLALESITKKFPTVTTKNIRGDTPLHVLCPLLNNVNEFVAFLTKKGARLDAENQEGLFPLAFWIYNGMGIDALSGLLDIKDLFPRNRNIFAQALTTTIMKSFFLPLQLETKQAAFTKFFIFLIEMGGYLKPKKHEISVWRDLGDEAFKNINIEMSTAFLENLEVRLQQNGNSDQEKVDFQSFICRTNIKPEIVFKALLSCKQYDAFEKLCAALAPKLKSMCSSPKM